MGETLNELRDTYEQFLRAERFGFVDRIVTAVDDLRHVAAAATTTTSKGASSPSSSSTMLRATPRVLLGLAEVRSHSVALSQRLRLDPLRHLRGLEAACHLIASEERPGYDKEGIKIKVALTGPIGAAAASPRQLTSSSLRQLVSVEGVATKVSTIKPKVVKSVHYCPDTQTHQSKDYVDATDPHLGLRAVDASGTELADRIINVTSSVYPTKDAEGHMLETEFGLSVYKDHQTITLQEMPEKAPMGQLPRSVELILDHDLVDRIKPGDRVLITGVYRALATNAQTGQQSSSGVFRTVVLVNHVQVLGRNHASQLSFLPQDIRMIRSLAQRKDILDILGRSVAPSIYGHGVIKKALALQLLGGMEKNLENGTHLRGDINILMVGDPSTAKSQLLRSAMQIAPLAVSTTGKGSSGVGLTAAVTSDPDTRERRLEAGAMVLADSGLVCVDEFDKMGENDRVAIHEAMEQQTVTIAKAGIHASLNARCSVLAAANPVYGQYNRRRRLQENIGLPDSLLSRFDLLFVVLDQMDPTTDRRIAHHVVGGHRCRNNNNNNGGHYDSDDDNESDDDDDGGGEKVHHVWQPSRDDNNNGDDDDGDGKGGEGGCHEVLQHEFLRKYIHYAKTRIQPVLTEAAREFIANRYSEMRIRQDERTLPITARSLETVIRLATAHAKARLSHVVEAEPDCRIAMDILGFALYHEQAVVVDAGTTLDDDGNGLIIGAVAAVSPDHHHTTKGDEDDVETVLPPNKRPRLHDDHETAVQVRLWAQLQEHDGMLELSQIDKGGDSDDGSLVQAAIQRLVQEGRILLDGDYLVAL